MADAEGRISKAVAPSAAPISFGFTRTSVRRRLADPGDGAGSAPEEKDFLKTVEGRELLRCQRRLIMRLSLWRPTGWPCFGAWAGNLARALAELSITCVPFCRVVKPRVNSLRPKGLGLGANLTKAQASASSGSCCPPRPDGEQEKDKEDQLQGLVPGGAVVVLSGPHRGLYGKVEGLDPDNVRVMVRLAVGSRMVTVSEYCLQPVSQQEFDKNLHPGQVNRTSSGQHSGASSSQKALQSEDLHGRQKDSGRKRKHPPDRQDRPVAKSEKAVTRSQHWLHRDLRVRFVDKLHKGGQYYNTKMTIEDVLSRDTCVCRTDEGQVLEGLREDMLETLVPKVEGDRVMVVLGPQAGRVGHLLGQDRARSQALVQLRRENQLVELHYDAICQYMGPSDSDED
ncbi:G patch domain and KOW motifs-containing protein isoform X2 [Heterocephalus glaber]|uniref:G-patch domain and KOW motifs-containing protein n=1 Tax=Heterocephalus glaber TaxID=10181 RepID=A0AAX6S915_HETGA|nr:G patch domain and KOW motifs-containing protein isoform X2 [Heterocephalus glaber]